MAARTRRFYARYPQHVQTVRRLAAQLQEQPAALPGGGLLTDTRLLQLGLGLGSGAGMESLHYLLEDPWGGGAPGGPLSYAFLHAVEAQSAFDTNPLYAVAHEAIYCSGRGAASAWAAERVRAELPDFDHAARLATPDAPLMLTGEHVFRSNFEGEYAKLPGLKEAARLLAERADWPALYDQRRLRECTVPTAAAVYYGARPPRAPAPLAARAAAPR
jgi:hypothetical protein